MVIEIKSSSKNNSIKKGIRQNSGQAIVEYLLLVVVILSMFYILAKQFFEPLQRYGSSVFTSTIACSLEYGQLPADIKSEEGCSASLQANITRSNQQRTNTNSNSRKSSSTSEPSKGDGTKNSSPGSRETETSNSQGRSSSSGQASRGPTLNQPTGTDSKTLSKKELMVSENSRGGSEVVDDSNGLRRMKQKSLTKPISGDLATALNLKKNKGREVRRAVSEISSENQKKSKRFIVNNKKKEKGLDIKEESWDLSKIIRMALIILMILVIIIFVFFQLVQIRKGAES